MRSPGGESRHRLLLPETDSNGRRVGGEVDHALSTQTDPEPTRAIGDTVLETRPVGMELAGPSYGIGLAKSADIASEQAVGRPRRVLYGGRII